MCPLAYCIFTGKDGGEQRKQNYPTQQHMQIQTVCISHQQINTDLCLALRYL